MHDPRRRRYDTDAREELLIACTLAPATTGSLLKWIAELMGDALHTCECRDLVLTLRFAPEAAERVRELVRRESSLLGGFPTFELHESATQLRLTIRAPEEARPAVSTIFKQFVHSDEPVVWPGGLP